MHVILATVGTDGDVFPHVGLRAAVRRRGTAPPEMPGGLTIPAWSPRPLRRLYWLAVDAVAYAIVARPLNRVRAGLGLPPVRRLFRWWLSPDLVLGLFPGWYA